MLSRRSKRTGRTVSWQIVKNIKLRIFSHELSSINFEVRFEIGLKVTLSLSVSLSLSPSFTRSSLFSLTPLSLTLTPISPVSLHLSLAILFSLSLSSHSPFHFHFSHKNKISKITTTADKNSCLAISCSLNFH